MKNVSKQFLTITLLLSGISAFAMQRESGIQSAQLPEIKNQQFENEKKKLFEEINKSKTAKEKKGATVDEQLTLYAREVERLFDRSENPKALANAKDEAGWPALGQAGRNGLDFISGLLIKHGADVNATSTSGNPIFRDVMASHDIPTIKRFLRQGDLNINFALQGLTPLHMAVSQGPAEAALLLIKAGADVNAKTKSGQSVLFYAKHASPNKVNAEEKAQILQMLKDKGAQE